MAELIEKRSISVRRAAKEVGGAMGGNSTDSHTERLRKKYYAAKKRGKVGHTAEVLAIYDRRDSYFAGNRIAFAAAKEEAISLGIDLSEDWQHLASDAHEEYRALNRYTADSDEAFSTLWGEGVHDRDEAARRIEEARERQPAVAKRLEVLKRLLRLRFGLPAEPLA
jgi:hypothetical protein